MNTSTILGTRKPVVWSIAIGAAWLIIGLSVAVATSITVGALMCLLGAAFLGKAAYDGRARRQ